MSATYSVSPANTALTGKQHAAASPTISRASLPTWNGWNCLPSPCCMVYCLGLALELALACDFRIAVHGALLGLPETRLGMIPDVGGTTRLTRLVGPSRAKELIFTGKQIEAAQAEAWGIVNYVVAEEELLAKGEALAAEINQGAPLAVGMAKRVIDGLSDVDRGLLLEGWAQSQLFNTADFMEGAQAFMMRRPPVWQGK
ncbi:MAG: enoyl-CoA hydratase-related protein [Chloroflexi bacterium]|nr:enoyl-CoA hydratase-related protein [Chloroflexota bacterium]